MLFECENSVVYEFDVLKLLCEIWRGKNNYSKNQPLISNWHSPEKLSTLITFLRRFRNFLNTFEQLVITISAHERAVISAHASARVSCHLQIHKSRDQRWDNPDSKQDSFSLLFTNNVVAAAVQALRQILYVGIIECKVSVSCVGYNFECSVHGDRFVLRGVSTWHLYASDL